LEEQLISQEEYFIKLQEMQAEQFIIENENLVSALEQKLITKEQFLAAEAQLEAQYAAESRKTEFEKNKARQQNFKDTMSTIVTLQSSANKELAAIGKAAAIYNATIDGYAAVQKALGAAPPPFNFALAAVVGAATAANVAKIAGVSGFARGTDSVPRSSSGGNLGDNFPAMLQAGERVVPTETNKDLTNFLNNQKQGPQVTVNLTIMPNTGLNNEQIGNFIEQLNNFFAAGGLKLTGAT
jgi:hypothetical protein